MKVLTIENKHCPKCDNNKPIINFYKNKQTKSGYACWCISCDKEKGKKYYNDNLDIVTEKHKIYRIAHKEEYKAYRREYNKTQRRTSHAFKVKEKIQRLINKALNGQRKYKRTFELLGYTLNDLVKHLKTTLPDGYIWRDYLDEKKLHIDHIIPKSLYKYESFEDNEFKKCWDINNLRLLPAKENMKKHAKLDFELVKEYNILHLLPNGEK